MGTNLEYITIYTVLLGSTYLLISLGFSLVCGVMRMLHLGYASFFMLTVYGTWMFMTHFGWLLWPAILGMVVILVIVAALVYKGILARQGHAHDMMLPALLLVSVIAEQTASYLYPVHTGVYLDTMISLRVAQIGQVIVPMQLIATAGAAFFLTGALALMITKTRMGFALRAVSEDMETARIAGVHVEAVHLFTLMIALIPVIVGMLLISPLGVIEPGMGWSYMTTAILVTVLGGLGNIRGAIAACFLIGFVHAVISYGIGEPRFLNLSTFILVMAVIIIRPRGLARSASLW